MLRFTLAIIVAFTSHGCLHTKMRYVAQLENREDTSRGKEFVYEDYDSNYVITGLCGLTFWLYGGACWGYFLTPLASDQKKFRQSAYRAMRSELPKSKWRLIDDRTNRAGYFLLSGNPNFQEQNIEWEEDDEENDAEESTAAADDKVPQKDPSSSLSATRNKARIFKSRQNWLQTKNPWLVSLELTPFDFVSNYSSYYAGIVVARRINGYLAWEIGAANGEVGELGRGSIGSFAVGSWHLQGKAGMQGRFAMIKVAGGLSGRRIQTLVSERRYDPKADSSEDMYPNTIFGKVFVETVGFYWQVGFGGFWLLQEHANMLDLSLLFYHPMIALRKHADTYDGNNPETTNNRAQRVAEQNSTAFSVSIGFPF